MTQFATERQMRNALNIYLGKQYTKVKRPSINLVKFSEEILKYCHTNLRPKTTEIYERTLTHLVEQVGDIDIKKITPTDLENYKSRRSITASKTTVNMEIRNLKTIIGLAVKWGYLEYNIAYNLKQIRIPEKDYNRFSKDDLKKILCLIRDTEFKTLIQFAYYTGCRSSEICNLQWTDIDFDKKLIKIRNKNNFVTKTGKQRSVPINDILCGILTDYKKALLLYGEVPSEDYVFLNNKKTAFNKDIISKRFKRILRKAGLSDSLHFHHLRHTSLSDMMQNGVNIYNVKEIAGHSSIKTTEQYLHANFDELYKSMNTLNMSIVA